MAALNSKLLKDTRDLIRFYNTNPDFKRLFDTYLPTGKATFQRRPLKLYVKLLSDFSTKYKTYYREYFAHPDIAGELLTAYYNDPKEFPKLLKGVENSEHGQEVLVWPKLEHQTLEQIEYMTDDEKRHQAFEEFLVKKDRTEGITAEVTPTSNEPIYMPASQKAGRLQGLDILAAKVPNSRFQIPSAVKNVSSQAQILARKMIARYPSQLLSVFTGSLGSVFGGAVMGGGIPGALAGATGGLLFPKVIQSGGGEMILRGGSRMMDGAMSVLGGGARVATVLPVGKIVVGVFLVIFILPMFLNILKSSSPFSPFEVAESAPLEGGPSEPTTPGGGSSDIAACLFQRGDRTPKSEVFQSSTLLGYFQEVSEKTSVPASLLAAVARVETPGSTAWTNEQAQSGSICPQSGDIAVGLMQIIAPWSHRSDAYCKECVDQGASYFGKTASELTREDFCDPRRNIYIGAGFILKKLQLGYRLGNGTQWDPSWTDNQTIIYNVAKSFYGCLEYGAGNNRCEGNFNYGLDIYTSVQACKPIAPPVIPPVNPPTGDLRLAIKQNFNIDFQDTTQATPGIKFTDKELGWAWEALSAARAKSPKFDGLLKSVPGNKSNKVILAMHSASSAETFNSEDPIRINLRDTSGGPFSGPDLFKQILIHELGHIVHGPAFGPRDPRYNSGLTAAQSDDRRKLTCYSEVNIDESFSELVSYYLLDNLPNEQPTSNCSRFWPSSHPLKTGFYPSHLQFIQSILGGTTNSTIAVTKQKITLDPGHGNPDLYSEQKADENILSLAVAKATQGKLAALGYDVVLTKNQGELDSAGYYQDLQSRINTANQRGGILVSVHFDKNSAANISGYANHIKGYYKFGDANSKRLADSISQKLGQNLPSFSVGISTTGDYYLLNSTGAATDCQNGKVINSNIPCNVNSVQSGLQGIGIIQEIFPSVANYSQLNSQINNIAVGYCQGILNYFADSRSCGS